MTHIWLAISCVACLAAAGGTAVAQGAGASEDFRPAPPPQNDDDNDDDDDDKDAEKADCKRDMRGNCIPEPPPKPINLEAPEVVAKRLLATGPEAPARADAEMTTVRGFVRDGWPVVVDFEPEPGTRTQLVVAIYDGTLQSILTPRKVKLVMDADGSGGRQLFTGRIELPADLGGSDGSVGIADLNVVSRRLNAKGKPKKIAPVRVFGIGAGPRAVGSISVTNVSFAGSGAVKLAPGGKTVDYGFLLKQPFDLVSADLWRTCTAFLCRESMFSRQEKRISGGRTGTYKIAKQGVYRLTVRAWLSCAEPDFRKCADSAAWATGRSAPVTVAP